MWLDRLLSIEPTKVAKVAASAPPRAIRFQFDGRVSFVGDDCRHEGRCINVSQSGLLAKFDEPPEMWTSGLLLLEAGDHYLSIPARVARIQDKEAGLAFYAQTDNDRTAISILIDSASRLNR